VNLFIWNLAIALGWTALTGQLSALNLLLGFVLGYFLLWLASPRLFSSRYFIKVRKVFEFVFYFGWELIVANLRVAYDVVMPKQRMTPGVIAIPLEARTDAEIVVLASCITLTPGTLSMDVSGDRKVLYIHAMYIQDLAKARNEIKTGMERRVLEVLR
jgi:multicomponent Na+:H+ antiporter subunit E